MNSFTVQDRDTERDEEAGAKEVHYALVEEQRVTPSEEEMQSEMVFVQTTVRRRCVVNQTRKYF